VNIRNQHALTKVIEHHHPHGPAQPVKSFLVQFGPDEEPNRLPAVAESHHEQPGAPILAALRIADHGAGAVIYLTFFTRSRDDHDSRLGNLDSPKLPDKALHALIAAGD
jgi:hypothetical protein